MRYPRDSSAMNMEERKFSWAWNFGQEFWHLNGYEFWLVTASTVVPLACNVASC
jgi:hypothetical protein